MSFYLTHVQFLSHPLYLGYQTDFKNLRESGLEKVRQGITDEKEIERVLGKNS